MMDKSSIVCTTASGKSLEELSRLIALRTERLGELSKDAVIAAAIDVLVSLRADTMDARKGDRADPPQRITPRRDLYISFRGASRIPCLRRGSAKGEEVKEGSFYFSERNLDIKTLTVYQIVPRHDRIKPYFVAAPSASAALKFEGAKIRARIAAKGGLARSALGVAMTKLSTRNTGDDAAKAAKILASRLSHVTITGSGYSSGEFGLEYLSSLNYQIAAFKSGDGAVDTAFQKAANKIAGMITHAAHQAGDFEHDVKTPFPDIIKRRR